jgi:hypothetical protein
MATTVDHRRAAANTERSYVMTRACIALVRPTWIALCIGLVTVAPARAQAAPDPRAPEAIAAYAGHYVTRGRAFDDLNELEAAVRSARPAAVRIVSCEAAAARAWAAAAHRFDDLPQRLEVREPDAAICGPVPIRARGTSSALPRGIDDAAVRRYWEQRHP